MEKVSIIVPVFNSENTISKCIDSIISQTYANWEIILVDDCSSDGSVSICQKYADRYENIHLIIHNNNQGPSSARNHGMAVATGDWIMFVDSDDYIDKNCLGLVVAAQNETGADIVMFGLVNHFLNGTTEIHRTYLGERVFGQQEIKNVIEDMLTLHSEDGSKCLNLTGPVCKLIRSSIANSCKFPEKINSGEDVCFLLQVFRRCAAFVKIDYDLYHRVVLDSSLSFKFDINYVNRRRKYVTFVDRYCRKKGIADENVLADFTYMNYISVINNYVHLKPTMGHLKAKHYIEKYWSHDITKNVTLKQACPDKISYILLKVNAYYLFKLWYLYGKRKK